MGQTSFGNDTRKTVLHTEMSTSSGRSSSTGSDSAETVTRPTSGQSGQSHGVYQPMYYQYIRRQTPEEDYLSTQQGIEILVKQRQELVDQLTKHYRKLHRSNDIEQMLKFSQQIDSIMRLKGLAFVPSPNPSRARRIGFTTHRKRSYHSRP